MGTYTVTLDADQEIALQYALELALAAGSAQPPEEGQPPSPPPTLATMPQVLVNADLANRTRDLESLAAQTVAVLTAIQDQPVRQSYLGALVSPAMRAFLTARLAAGG